MSSVVDEIVVVPAHGKPALEDQFDLFDSDKEEINVEETHDKENNDEKLVEVHKLRAYEGSPPPQTKSINFEDVDDTNEGLIEMRGQGRYFGNFDEDEVQQLCNRCGKSGHKMAQCKAIICDTCGEKEKHTTKDCPKSKRCSKCGSVGHLRVDCTERRARGPHCDKCDLRTHNSDNCPLIWRNYLVKKSSKKHAHYPSEIYCYNCGMEGHYGDDCAAERQIQLMYVDESCFAGRSLNTKLKSQYNKDLKRYQEDYKRSAPSKRSYDDYDDMDYGYSSGYGNGNRGGNSYNRNNNAEKKYQPKRRYRDDYYSNNSSSGQGRYSNNSGYSNSGYNNSGYNNSGYNRNGGGGSGGNYRNSKYRR